MIKLSNHLRRLLSAVALLSVSVAVAADIKTVIGEYTFVGDGTQSPVECRRLALEGARVQALAREFGTVVSQDVYQRETVDGNGEDTYFSSMSATEVKGEWIADVGEPVYNTFMDNDGNLVVTCRIKGQARAISNESVDFQALILRNGKDAKNADTRFRNGDDMFMSFLAPVDGYVAAFLVGDDRQVYRLLPYGGDSTGSMKVKHGKPYVFFDRASGGELAPVVDEYTLTASASVERNSIYVVFAVKPFSIGVDSRQDAGLPPQQSFAAFSKWLSESRRRDPRMGVKVMHIEITN